MLASGPSSNDDYLGHFKKTMITYLLTYHAFDQFFDTKSSELVVSSSQTRSSRTKAWSKTRVFDQAFDLLD